MLVGGSNVGSINVVSSSRGGWWVGGKSGDSDSIGGRWHGGYSGGSGSGGSRVVKVVVAIEEAVSAGECIYQRYCWQQQ